MTSLEEIIASARDKAINDDGKIIIQIKDHIPDPFALIRSGFLPVIDIYSEAEYLMKFIDVKDEWHEGSDEDRSDYYREIIRKELVAKIDVYKHCVSTNFGMGSFSSVEVRNYILEQLALGMTEEELRFWLRREPSTILDPHRWQFWSYCTIARHRSQSEQTGNSLPLLLYAPDQVYNSRRAVTSMQIFRSSKSVTIKSEEIKDGKYLDRNVIPVTRYGTGMSRGLYHDSDVPSEFYGTFYYHEPESRTFLAFHRSITCHNKLDAFYKLTTEVPTYEAPPMINALIEYYKTQFGLIHTASPQQREEMVWKTPLEFWRENPELKYGDLEFSEEEVSKLPQTKRYVGMALDLYALEDDFDQIILELGRRASYDIIILEQMVGSHQLVTEILDTRPRSVSFDNLIYLRA